MPKIWVDRTTLNGEEKEDGLKAITLASHDHKDLVQIWLIKNPDLSGKSRISTAFKPNKSTARSAAKNRDFKTAWSLARI